MAKNPAMFRKNWLSIPRFLARIRYESRHKSPHILTSLSLSLCLSPSPYLSLSFSLSPLPLPLPFLLRLTTPLPFSVPTRSFALVLFWLSIWRKMVLVAVGWQLLWVVLAMMGLVLVAMTICFFYNPKPTTTDMTPQIGNYASR